jgi:hypothetical protein
MTNENYKRIIEGEMAVKVERFIGAVRDVFQKIIAEGLMEDSYCEALASCV